MKKTGGMMKYMLLDRHIDSVAHYKKIYFLCSKTKFFYLKICIYTLFLATFCFIFPVNAEAPTFYHKHTFGTVSMDSLAIGDINSDGHFDIIAGSSGQNKVYLNDGMENFTTEIPFGNGNDSTYSIAVADVNGDGYIDIIVGNWKQTNMAYLNNGIGGFITGIPFGTGSDPATSIAVGDVNRDGHLDLIVGNLALNVGDDKQNAVYLNDGTGHFPNTGSYTRTFGTGDDNTRSVALGDMNSDGYLDIIAGNYDGQQNVVYLNDGTGNFPNTSSYTRTFGTGNDWSSNVEVGDINSDGYFDIIVGNSYHQQNIVYLNDGTGNFPNTSSYMHPFGTGNDQTNCITIGDVNSDGAFDIIVCNELEQNVVYLNDGEGNFTVGVPFGDPNTPARGVAIGDMNNDGSLDLIMLEGAYNAIYFNNGGGDFIGDISQDVSQTRSTVVGDINRDGYLDIVFGNDGQQNVVYLNDGTGGFLNGGSYIRMFGTGHDKTQSVEVGDVNSDGHLDLVVGNDGQQNVVYLNDGTGRFPNSDSYIRPFGTENDKTWSVVTGDLNEDGYLDLVVGNDGQQNVVYLNDGTGNFPNTSSYTHTFGTGNDWTRSVELGDMNGDGYLDIIVGNYNEQNTVCLNDGEGHFMSNGKYMVAFSIENDQTTSVATGDMNGDGALDIVVGNRNEWQRNTIYMNDGTGSFKTTSTFGAVNDDALSLAIGDVDGDDDLDIFVGHDNCRGAIYINNGIGNFDIYKNFSGFKQQTHSIAVGDLDNDGDIDLIIGNFGQNVVLKNGQQGRIELPNNPPFLKVTRPVTTSNAAFHSSPVILDNRFIPITYTLFDLEGDRVGGIATFYSLDGGGRWLPAIATADTLTQNLSLGTALAFDGVNDWVETESFDIDNDFTISLWTKPYTTTDSQAFIAKNDATSSMDFVRFGFYDGGYSFRIRDASFVSGTKTSDWQHLTIVGKGNSGTTDVTVYRNGEVLWQSNLAAVIGDIYGGKPWAIGQDWDYNIFLGRTFFTDFFHGLIDEVRIWNIAHSQTEVKADMYRQLQGDEVGLVAYWTFDEGTGNTVIDQTANHYDGTLGGGIDSREPNWVGAYFTTCTYTWDTFASGFFGQSDNVVLRMVAYPQPATAAVTGTYKYYNNTPGPFQRPYASATTFPFRVRGTQVRVYSETVHISNTVGNALVYRENADIGSYMMANNAGIPFRTNRHGYLQGRGQLAISDTLMALAPVHTVQTHEGIVAFNGQDDWAETTDFDIADDFTISLWVNPYITTTAKQAFVSKHSLSGGDLVLLGFYNDGYCLRIRNDVFQGGIKTTGWQHLAVVGEERGGTTDVTFYKNGEILWEHNFSTVVGDVTSSKAWAIAQDWDGDKLTDFFAGAMDEIRIWNVARSQSEIQADMLRKLKGNEPGLVAYWPFDDPEIATSGMFEDQTDNSYGGILHGATWSGDYLGGYTVYHTNGVPTEDGVDAFTVREPGVQAITVTAQHPLILFDLNLSLEWDAHNDPVYLQQLAIDLKKASAYLYDFTDGQVALGKVRVYQNADGWGDAHIAVQASNRLRPFAHIGGLLTDIVSETVMVGDEAHTLTYGPGQIRMGATWNRYGNPGQSTGVDWPLILAHELSHYLLYQYDVYIGLNDDGLLVPEDACTGSAMGDVYNLNNTEFITSTLHWTAACSQTLAAKTVGRTEWDTLKLHYPWLNSPTLANDGPSQMPFAFTTVEIVSPTTVLDTIEDPTFYLDYEHGYVSSSEARAFLLRDADVDANGAPLATGPDDYDYLYDLGNPIGGQNRVLARGAQPGDRLCVFDPARTQYGCEVLTKGDERLSLKEDMAWTPILQVTPVNSTTFTLSVSGLATPTMPFTLHARLLPEFGAAFTPTTLSFVAGVYTGTLSLPYPVMWGHIQLWADTGTAPTETAPRPETITSFSIGGNPGIHRVGGIGIHRVGGIGIHRVGGIGIHRVGGIGIHRVGGIAPNQAGEAPMVSPDGQMILYTPDDLTLAEGQFFTIQAMAGLPDLHLIPGRTAVGPGYHLVATGFLSETRALTGSVSIQYLGSDVLAAGADEDDLDIYYWDGQDWIMLETVLDTTYNMASAHSHGPGIYALFASVKIALYGPGWNNFAYHARATLPVTQALLSISGYYTTVYGYDADDSQGDPWKVYDVTVPEMYRHVVNDLQTLEFGQGYWINVSEAITLYLSSEEEEGGEGREKRIEDRGKRIENLEAILPRPPAMFYGVVHGVEGWTPETGMTVRAWVEGKVCGQGQTQRVGDDVVYAVNVLADGADNPGCGTPGKMVTFKVNGHAMVPSITWDDRQLWDVALRPGWRVYLPVIVKQRP